MIAADRVIAADGFTQPHGVQRSNLGGRDLTDYAHGLLAQSGALPHPHTQSVRAIVNRIKETCCYVASNFTQEFRLFNQQPPHTHAARQQRLTKARTFSMVSHPRVGIASVAHSVTRYSMNAICDNVMIGGAVDFEMPDGSFITLDTELFQIPELMFQPNLLKNDDPDHRVHREETLGLHQLAAQSVSSCDLDIRKDLLQNIVLSGGTTMFPNMPERLQAEVEGLVAEGAKVKVIAPPERMNLIWRGGAILVSLSTFNSRWMHAIRNQMQTQPLLAMITSVLDSFTKCAMICKHHFSSKSF